LRRCSTILIIGIGNEYRRDDGVGVAVAKLLREQNLPHTTIIAATGEGTALMEAWAGAGTVILVDAVVSGAVPGTVHRFDALAQPVLPELFNHSTHAFGVAGAIELGRVLNRLPARLIFYGIEGEDFASGVGLSAAVEGAVPPVAGRIGQEVGQGVNQPARSTAPKRPA